MQVLEPEFLEKALTVYRAWSIIKIDETQKLCVSNF